MLNIQEIALKVWYSKNSDMPADGINKLANFAEALIAEIAKQNEPLCTAAMLDEWFLSKSGVDPKLPLYTIPPSAEQIANETAEAIAEYCSHQGHYCLSAEIESGAWKEFKN